MPGIWTYIFLFGIYATIAGYLQKENNRRAGRPEDDPAGAPGCFTPLFVVIGWIGFFVLLVRVWEWLLLD